jgi:CRISPR-associated protein Cmr6
MVFDRPKRPGQSSTERPLQTPSQSTGKPKKVITTGGNKGNGGYSGGGGNSGNSGGGDVPSPWLGHPTDLTPQPDRSASFVEYLRWMRAPDSAYKDPTKIQILQMASDQANYCEQLTKLTNRTKLIAGVDNCFQVRCSWRLRVGGHRGPESILLPAFDALGMPYIPSSTLRGVARTQAIREFMETEELSWQAADLKVARWFGHLSAEPANQAGKIIFFDAYPLPGASGKGGLAMDMANNLWSWDGARQNLEYSPNPNPFFSLKEATFLIGLRSTIKGDPEVLTKVKGWLIRGLQAGIGSQVNTGYGSLTISDQPNSELARFDREFFSVEFSLQGQLIHGEKNFKALKQPYRQDHQTKQLKRDSKGNLLPDTSPKAEVRPVAFKSMLCYWFRAFALGILPAGEVQNLEANLFGAIQPKPSWGWVTVNIMNGKVVQREARAKTDPCGEQTGRLILSYAAGIPDSHKETVAKLFKTLTWLMFHLGGVGQGARRPCYSRKNRERAPWWRGSTLIPETEDAFWNLPENVQEFQKLFRKRLKLFYAALDQLTTSNLNFIRLQVAGQVRQEKWTEAIDANCQIIVCAGEEGFGKPYALRWLHSEDFKQRGDYDGNLCGQVQGGVKPSPIWIADLGDYQVVTVFGATFDPRKRYLEKLKDEADNFAQIFPLT